MLHIRYVLHVRTYSKIANHTLFRNIEALNKKWIHYCSFFAPFRLYPDSINPPCCHQGPFATLHLVEAFTFLRHSEASKGLGW